MVICLERDADLHMAHLKPLPLIVSCFSKIQIGFTFLVPAHLGSPGKRAVKRVCVGRGPQTDRQTDRPRYVCTAGLWCKHGGMPVTNFKEFVGLAIISGKRCARVMARAVNATERFREIWLQRPRQRTTVRSLCQRLD